MKKMQPSEKKKRFRPDKAKKPKILMIGAMFFVSLLIFCIYGGTAANRSNFWTVYDFNEPVLRVHVIAHNDRPKEQRLKNIIQKEFIENISPRLKKESFSELLRLLSNEKENMESILSEIVLREGFEHEIGVHLERELFPLRHYAGEIYPPGEYLALKIAIGDAKGENWWCLLYPPLCFPIAELLTGDTGEERKTFSESESTSINENKANNELNKGGDNRSGSAPKWRIKIWEWILSLWS